MSVRPAPGEVVVRDDAIPGDLMAPLQELLRMPIWAYGWKSSTKRDRFGFWHAHFAGGDEASSIDCAEDLGKRAVLEPVARLWEHLSRGHLRGHYPVRVYANAHTFGVEGYLHTDSTDRDYFSTILYAHPRWRFNWAGETAFVDRESEAIIASVHPRPGRLVTFSGATPHVARAPSRECPELRVTVVVKTRLIDGRS